LSHEGDKVVSPTHRPPLPAGNIPGTYICYRLSRPQGHSTAGRIMSVKNSIDTIGNRTRNFPVCNSIPQPTEPPRAPIANLEHQADVHGTGYECRANEESPFITIFNLTL